MQENFVLLHNLCPKLRATALYHFHDQEGLETPLAFHNAQSIFFIEPIGESHFLKIFFF